MKRYAVARLDEIEELAAALDAPLVTAGGLIFIGTTADATAISTGLPVSPLRSEISNNYDLSLRYRNRRFDMNLRVGHNPGQNSGDDHI